VTRVDQLLPRLAARDAIGAHALHVRAVLRDAGIDSDIYAAEWDADVAGDVTHFSAYPDDPATWLLYHASVGSHVGEWFRGRRSGRLLDYHNVTPHEFFDPWAPEIAGLLVSGRHQLADLAPEARAGIADSHFNELELRAAGCDDTAVVPVMVDVARGTSAVDDALLGELRAGKRGADWVFVGRVAPNKAHDELLKAFAVYRRAYDADARLWMVGGESSVHYRVALERFIDSAGLRGAAFVTGSVGDGALGAYYEAADVFVCVSHHEGFCVPVLEAMAHDVPVVARATAAVPETVGDAGVLVPPGAPRAEIAAAVWEVVSRPRVRDALVAAGRRRVDHFSLARTGARLLDALTPVVTESVAA
jgi:glycosyltransferase involved in cell wall biosynthesis